MPDKNADKVDVEETAAEAAPETAAEAPEATVGADEPMPGLDAAFDAGAVEAAVAEAGAITRLEAECIELKDKLLRALAESENVRRRAERGRKDAEAYGGTRLARDLLGVHDNLDRALSHIDDALREQAKDFIEGVELTQRELLNAFAKHRIERVSPAIGEKFDPHSQQAMFEAPFPGAKPGTVIEVMQAGFTIAGRLLRPALVGVAGALPKSEPATEAAEPEKAAAAHEGNGAG